MDARTAVLGMLVLGAVCATDVLFKLRPEVDVVADALAVASPGQDRTVLSSAILDVLADHFHQGRGQGTNTSLTLCMCCQCTQCQRWCPQCQRSCCCQGLGSCLCTSCVNSPDKAFQFEAETFKMLTYADRVKVALRQKVMAITGLPDSKLQLLDGVVDTYLAFLE